MQLDSLPVSGCLRGVSDHDAGIPLAVGLCLWGQRTQPDARARHLRRHPLRGGAGWVWCAVGVDSRNVDDLRHYAWLMSECYLFVSSSDKEEPRMLFDMAAFAF